MTKRLIHLIISASWYLWSLCTKITVIKSLQGNLCVRSSFISSGFRPSVYGCLTMCISDLKSSLFPMSQAVGWHTTLRPSSGFTSMEFVQKLSNILYRPTDMKNFSASSKSRRSVQPWNTSWDPLVEFDLNALQRYSLKLHISYSKCFICKQNIRESFYCTFATIVALTSISVLSG